MKTSMFLMTMLLVSWLGVMSASPALADIRPDPLVTGGSTPKARTVDGGTVPVRMAWEEVDLYPSAAKNRVVAVFGLKNESDEAVAFEVGFPSYYEGRLHDFEVKVGDEKRLAELKREDPPEGARKRIFTYWMCWPMSFKPGEEKRVEVCYWCETEREDRTLHARNLPEDLKAKLAPATSGYVLRTGRDWAGTIGRAVIRLHYGDEVKKGNLKFMSAPLRRGKAADDAASWIYDPEADVDQLVLEELEPDARSDIRYTFTLVTPKEATELLLEALAAKTLDPWAMKHVLELVEKEDALGLSNADRKAKALEILELMVPPKGPRFEQQGPGEKRGERALKAGAEKVLREAFARLHAHAVEAGDAAKLETVRGEYARFLTPIVLRAEAYFGANPDKKRGWSWNEYQKRKATLDELGGPVR